MGWENATMKCDQCERPAFFVIAGKIPLCIHCHAVLMRSQHTAFLMTAVAANQALDDMQMITGLRPGGGRIPVAEIARALQGSTTLNNFNLTNSQIGVLNTGTIQKIDAAITLTQGSDLQEIGDMVRGLTDAIIASDELAAADRDRLLDLIEALTQQLVRDRKPAIISALMRPILEGLKGVAAILPLAAKLSDALQ